MNRQITDVRIAQASRDGDGVAIQRVAGMRDAGMDPILMIDELHSDNRDDFAGGFPPHPHRGMQTLTYMKQGGFRHQDSMGNVGEIRDGGAQWMSAGSGVIHSEMPLSDTEGMHGFQIWINLPAADKMSAPQYRDIPSAGLARVTSESFNAATVSGVWQLDGEQIEGPLNELATTAGIIDLTILPNQGLSVELQTDESAIAYIYSGSLRSSDNEHPSQHLLVSGEGDSWELLAGAQGAGVIVLKGRPLNEPVAHYGPFVMNRAEEIEQAIQDYQAGRLVQA